METEELKSAKHFCELWKDEKIQSVEDQDFETAAHCREIEKHYLELIELLEK